jgi:Berberine and berberine like
MVELRHLGGALSRPPAVPNAMGRRDGEFCLYSGAAATGSEVAPLRSAFSRLHAAMEPWGTGGVCLNFLSGPDVTSAQLRSAYRPADVERLLAIKRTVDPANLFRITHSFTDGPR